MSINDDDDDDDDTVQFHLLNAAEVETGNIYPQVSVNLMDNDHIAPL
jgi:hypothetical protein